MRIRQRDGSVQRLGPAGAPLRRVRDLLRSGGPTPDLHEAPALDHSPRPPKSEAQIFRPTGGRPPFYRPELHTRPPENAAILRHYTPLCAPALHTEIATSLTRLSRAHKTLLHVRSVFNINADKVAGGEFSWSGMFGEALPATGIALPKLRKCQGWRAGCGGCRTMPAGGKGSLCALGPAPTLAGVLRSVYQVMAGKLDGFGVFSLGRDRVFRCLLGTDSINNLLFTSSRMFATGRMEGWGWAAIEPLQSRLRRGHLHPASFPTFH